MSTTVANDMRGFLSVEMEKFQSKLNGETNTTLNKVRKEAFARFEQLGFPTARHEEWRYTHLSNVLKPNYEAAQPVPVAAEWIEALPFADLKANRVVLVNGFYSSEHSHILDAGIGLYSIAALRKEKSELLNGHFAKYVPFEADAFTALNTAFLQDGLFIHIPEKTEVKFPVLVYHVANCENAAVFIQPRTIVVLGKESSVKVMEVAVSMGQYPGFTNYVAEGLVGENAQLSYLKLQHEAAHTSRVDQTRIVQEKNSAVSTLTITTSGELVRNTLQFLLNDKQTTTHLNGLYLAGKDSLIDNHTLVDHAMPHCYSNELYKGIVGSNGQAVFNGKVMVRKDAQKTNAYQRNGNVLLSDEAIVNTKPQLEIFADDVKCSHGATTGQIDEEALFYLRSRGIGVDVAKTLLMQAFAAEVLEMIDDEAVKAGLIHLIEKRIATL